MKAMKVVLDGFFYGISRERDTLDRKTGEVTYSQRPIIQILVSFPAGVIGARYELVNVTYTGSDIEEYYRRTKDYVGFSCTISVLQKYLETSKGSYLFHETHVYPDFEGEGVGEGSSLSPVSSSSSSSLGQRLAAAS
jgi:hypothetical protein